MELYTVYRRTVIDAFLSSNELFYLKFDWLITCYNQKNEQSRLQDNEKKESKLY